MKQERVIAYTDGAASNNQNAAIRRGGWSAILLWEVNGQVIPESQKEISGGAEGATNNQMELEAVRQVLRHLKREGLQLCIITDSSYVIGVLSQNWKVKANQDLVAEIKRLLSRHQVSFEKVAGHRGQVHNERADVLAKAASQS